MTAPPPLRRTGIRRLARERLGYEELRPGQGEAIEAVVAGRDTLAVLPTGGGKSAIYQLSGLVLDGPTLVVSPLLALQRDQVEGMEESDIAEAAMINSLISDRQRDASLQALETGALEFLLVAPEQLADDELLGELRRAKPSLVVIDEAHCISAWGHDFRPDYLRLGAVIDALGHPVTVALTATAAPPIREDIVARLRMRDPALIVRGFDRPNLFLDVRRVIDEDDRLEQLRAVVGSRRGTGIVYVATRKRTAELAAALADQARTASYHGGLPKREREAAQDAFMTGAVDVIVATNAFGMGIDKPDVRFVCHADAPDSLDSYYQEIGRAGRDGEPADAVLLYRPEDLGLRRYFASGGRLGRAVFEQIVTTVADRGGRIELDDLASAVSMTPGRVVAAVGRLERTGVLRFGSGGTVELTTATDASTADERAAQAEEAHHQLERTRVEMVRSYAEGRSCRRAAVLSYFGEPAADSCPACDNCVGIGVIDRGAPAETLASRPFPVGAQVAHREWGAGEVLRYDDDVLVVLFDEVGYRMLSVPLIVERKLLELA